MKNENKFLKKCLRNSRHCLFSDKSNKNIFKLFLRKIRNIKIKKHWFNSKKE